MRYDLKPLGYVVLVGALISPVILQAADVTVPDEYGRHIQQRNEIATMQGQFGDRIDLNSGSLEIVQTDIELPGKGPAMRVGRRYRPSDIYGRGHFNYWDLDIPHLHGTFAKIINGGGWPGWGNPGNRCSQFTAPPDITYIDGSFSTDEYWSGSFLYLPGGGEQELMERGNAQAPTDGAVYPVVTKEGAAVRCVALAATSESGSSGEGFEVVGSDGMIYTLNQLVSRLERRLAKPDPTPMFTTGRAPAKHDPITPMVPMGYILPRQEILLFPTRVRDRFGNTVTYTWSTTNPWQLLRMEASAGRNLYFTYESGSNQVSTITDGSRTWTYAYGNPATLTLPDGTVWSYRLEALSRAWALIHGGVMCDNLEPSTNIYAGSITSPSGARLDLTMAAVKFGRSWVSRDCMPYMYDTEYAREPYLFVGLAVTAKKITGPGLPAAGMSWSYSYGAPNHCWNPVGVPPGNYPGLVACTAASPTTRPVSVTDPDNTVTRHTFGNRYQVDEGLPVKTEYGWNGTSALRIVTIAYADSEAAPYANFYGNSMRHVGDYDITSRLRPQRQVTTVQQGRTFTWQVDTDCSGIPFCFDAFARPTKVVKSSTP